MRENIFIKNKLKKIAIEKYLRTKLKSAGFIDVDVVKTAFNTRIVIYVLKPGFVIGKKGANIRLLTTELEEKFGFNKVHIEIGEIPNKNLDAKVIIENMRKNIGAGMTWKSVVYGALRQIREAGAIGAEIIAKGNTTGKGQRKRKSRFFFGYMKKAGDQKNLVSYEKATTFPSLGTIGIKLRIVSPDVLFSDKVDVSAFASDFKIKLEEERLEKSKKQADEKNTKQIDDQKSDEKEAKPVTVKKTKRKVVSADELLMNDSVEEADEKPKKKTTKKKAAKPKKEKVVVDTDNKSDVANDKVEEKKIEETKEVSE